MPCHNLYILYKSTQWYHIKSLLYISTTSTESGSPGGHDASHDTLEHATLERTPAPTREIPSRPQVGHEVIVCR